MFCPICGSSIENDSVFCPICGTKIVAETTAQPVYEAQPVHEAQPAYVAEPAPAQPEYIQPAPQAQYYQSTPKYAPTEDAGYAKKRGIALSAMIIAIISAFVIPWWFSPIILILACVSRKKLKSLKGYPMYGSMKAFATVAKAVSTFGFIWGLIGTIIWGIFLVVPIIIYGIYAIVAIIAMIVMSIGGGF